MAIDVTLERKLPHNLEAERSVLGAILLDNDAFHVAVRFIESKHFFLKEHGKIFARMARMFGERQPVDLVTLNEELERAGELEAAGGSAYLSALVDGVPRVSHVEHYARIVKQKALLRQLVKTGDDIAEQGCAPQAEITPLVVRAKESIARIEEGAEEPRRVATLQDIPGTGQISRAEIRWLVDGILPEGSLLLVAAEPGCYKSWFALLLARAIADSGSFLGRGCARRKCVVIFDRENPQALVLDRLELLGMRGQEWDNPKYWGRWEREEPPIIGDPRLRKWACDKPVFIFDSFLRFHAADENSATEMAVVMEELRRLCVLGATTVVIHHRAKSESTLYRGSSDILAGADLAVSLSREAGGLVKIVMFKNRFGPEFSTTVRPSFDELGCFQVVDSPAVTEERELVDRLCEVIITEPGLSQSAVLAKAGIPKQRATLLLHRFAGRTWLAEPGPKNSLRYFPVVGKQKVEVEV